ncbi:MAG TPA: aspartate-semialdehyde dehydrogenase [Candidatus Dormibacteraeota bacterium]|nr:aspartate-semialdehyde dehydrogenase [Candidatus Dormibacteraeota bacterium]
MKAAILGATGLVGQRFVQLLNDHEWFEISTLTGSERSAGVEYGDAMNWRMDTELKRKVAELTVQPTDPRQVDADVVFSALPAEQALEVEENFAKEGFAVVSNASAHRMDPDVPLMNPEANFNHLSLIDEQRHKRKWDGAIVTNPNCTTAVLTVSLKPIAASFGLRNVIVSSMQAASGAGYPGVASLDIIDNVIPFINGEEEKVQRETQKILGDAGRSAEFNVSASCHRVPVLDGHTEAVFVQTEKPASSDEVARCMEEFMAEPQKRKLPMAPERPIVMKHEQDRPQPRFDRNEGHGMAVVVGRVRSDPVFSGVKYVVLGHNTIRGAAGCAILIAESMKSEGYL